MNEASKAQWMLGCRTVWILLLVVVSVNFACVKETAAPVFYRITFLGHIYQPDREDRIDHRIADVNYATFDALLLGGDVCVETTRNQETLQYLDDLFNLSSNQTHWSWGNHDVRNGNLDWIRNHTQRDSYYYQDWLNMRIVVINTTLQDCNEMQAQHQLLLDAFTPDQSIDQILIISHHAIWTTYLEKLDVTSGANARHAIWRSFCPFDESSTFESSILPLLQDLANEEKSVIWIAGDFGQKVSSFEYLSQDGIIYLGSGIAENGRLKKDSILTLTWYPDAADMEWTFQETAVFAIDNQ